MRAQSGRKAGRLRAIARSLLAVCVVPLLASADEPGSLSLAGAWEFQLGPNTLDGNDLPSMPNRILLPGTVAGNGYGQRTQGVSHSHGSESGGRLSPLFEYSGVAWFARDVIVPEDWVGKPIELFLERCHWMSRVWWGGEYIGHQRSLSVPHRFVVSQSAVPGTHRLVVAVDNRYALNIGAHASAMGEDGHTNWNGMLGRIELRAHEQTQIDRVYGELASNLSTATVTVAYTSAIHGTAVQVRASIFADTTGQSVSESVWHGTLRPRGSVTLNMALQGHECWDEESPTTYTVRAEIVDPRAPTNALSRISTPFPMRHIEPMDRQFLLNGAPLYLRGTMDAAVFPITGHPPVDIGAWRDRLASVKSFGLNHVRFHSWCPPDAAFQAADELGIYVQVELPAYTTIDAKKEPELTEFLREEARAVLREYGNHPSFSLMAMGSQLEGDWTALDHMVAELKKVDPRRLYTFTSDHARLAPGPTSDYFVSLGVQDRSRFRRHEAYAGGDLPQPDTMYDLDGLLSGAVQPTVYHEIGQWAMYPDWSQIQEYDGLLKPRNLDRYHERERAAGLSGFADGFQCASTSFAAILLKEDFEAARRSKYLSGFQWYQLWDLPGIGEVLAGALDAVGRPKHGISESGLQCVFSSVLPLLRTPKFVWTQNEVFCAKVQLSQQGRQPLDSVALKWRIEDDTGCVIQRGQFEPGDFASGETFDVGTIEFPLAHISAPAQLTLLIDGEHVDAHNKWDMWIYPPASAVAVPGNVHVVRTLDVHTAEYFQNGGNVLLICQDGTTAPALIPMRFLPVTKSRSIFTAQPSSMGLLIDKDHPALSAFPTELHANWQWWGPLHAPALMFNSPELNRYFDTIVRVISDFHEPHQAAVLVETRVANGKLLACSLPLLDRQDDPAATQLYRSLVAYVSSPDFAPARTVTLETLYEMLCTSGRTQ